MKKILAVCWAAASCCPSMRSNAPVHPGVRMQPSMCGSTQLVMPLDENMGAGLAAALPNGRVLVLGTRGTDDETWSATLDAATGDWTLHDLPADVLVRDAVSLSDGTVLAIATHRGSKNPTFSTMYDPNRGRWDGDNPSSIGCEGALVALPGARALVVGSRCAALYSRSRGWTAVSSLPEPIHAFSVTVLADGRVLVAGGISEGNDADPDSKAVSTVYIADAEITAWRATGRLHQERFAHTAARLADGGAIVVGGCDNAETETCDEGGVASVEVYSPKSETWVDVPLEAAARTGHSVSILKNGSVLVLGGLKGDSTDVLPALLFDNRSDIREWFAAQPLASFRAHHSAVVLDDQQTVFVFGGEYPGPGSPAELYHLDDECPTWQPDAPTE